METPSSRIRDLEQQLALKARILERHAARVEKSQQKVQQKYDTYADWHSQQAGLEDMRELVAQAKRTKMEIASVDARLHSAFGMELEKERELEERQKRITEMETSINALKEKVSQAKRDKEDLQNRIDTDGESVRQQIAEAKANISAAESRNAEAERALMKETSAFFSAVRSCAETIKRMRDEEHKEGEERAHSTDGDGDDILYSSSDDHSSNDHDNGYGADGETEDIEESLSNSLSPINDDTSALLLSTTLDRETIPSIQRQHQSQQLDSLLLTPSLPRTPMTPSQRVMTMR